MEDRNGRDIFKVMTAAEEKARKSLPSKSFKKYVAVANSKNGDAFFDEVHLLFFNLVLVLIFLLMFVEPPLMIECFLV